MAQFTAVSRERHGDKAWLRFPDFKFAGRQHFIPVVGSELVNAARAMPLAFLQQANRFVLVGVLSLVPGRNLFVGSDGRWLGGTYVPSGFRSYPFRLGRRSEDDEWALLIDEAAGLVVDKGAGGEAFWAPDGSPSPATQSVLRYLQQLERDRALTERAVAALVEGGVIRPWELKVTVHEAEQPVAGLYRVDEAALTKLDDASFLKLREALPLAYAQVLSTGNLGIFAHLGRVQQQLERVAPKPEQSNRGLVDMMAQDTIRFD
jgi:SapC